MDRRTLIFGLGSLAAILPGSGYAQSLRSEVASWRIWKDVPAIAVVSTDNDYRLPAVREAVDFWNAELSNLGTPFRFGTLTHVVEDDPPGGPPYLRDSLAATTLTRSAKILSRMAPMGDVIVALSSAADFTPFTQARPDLQRVIVAIPDLPAYARVLRVLVRNIVAHELGHAIGLDHNDDPNALMCGARCNSFRLLSILPLTESDRARLLEMYPLNWQPKPFRKWITDPPYRPTFG